MCDLLQLLDSRPCVPEAQPPNWVLDDHKATRGDPWLNPLKTCVHPEQPQRVAAVRQGLSKEEEYRRSLSGM